MKKTALSLLLGATLIFSGCSIPGFSDEKTEPPARVVEKINTSELNKKSPEDQFYSLSSNNIAAWKNKVEGYLPSKEALLKNKTSFDLSGMIDLSSQMGTGSVNFSFNATGQKDITDEKDPKGSATIAFNLATKQTPISANAEGEIELRIVENGLYASLQNFTSQIPLAPQVEQMTAPFLGKWYGEKFEKISELTGDQLDIQKLVGSKSILLLMIEAMEEMQTNPTQVFTLVKALPEKNTDSMRYFETKMNPEFSIKMTQTMIDSFGITGDAKDEAVKNIAQTLEAQKDEIFIVGYNPADPFASTMEGPAIDMQTGEKIEGKTNIYSFSSDSIIYTIYIDDETFVNFTAQNNIFALTLTHNHDDNTEEITPLTGTYATDNVTFSLINPESDTKELIAEGKFSKQGDTWSGSITSPQEENIKASFSNISFNKGNFSTDMEIFGPAPDGTSASMGTIQIQYTIDQTDSVTVNKPASAEPFENIEKTLQELEKNNQPTIKPAVIPEEKTQNLPL